jgi:site-specific DNA recombinase
VTHFNVKQGAWVVSRFSRDSYVHHALRAQLSRVGVTLRSVNEPIDESSMGKFMENIGAAMAQLDNNLRADRSVQGMKARLERGGWTFPPPLGYIKSTDANGCKKIVPDPERGWLVTKAFEQYATGLYTRYQVLQDVSKLGLTTKRGKRVTPQTFHQLLRRPIYAGILEVPAWNISEISGSLPLVSQEIFYKVQSLIDGRRKGVTPQNRDNPDFPLRHFVRCGKCGRPLTASWSKGRKNRYAYYRCQNRDCKAVHVPRGEFERLFVDYLRQLRPKPQYLRLFGEIVVDVWEQRQARAVSLHDVAVRRLDELRGRKDKLVEAFVYKHQIDNATYQEQVERLNQEITLADIEERDARIEEMDLQAAVSFAGFVLLNAARLWTESSLTQKQRLQQAIFPRGVEFADGAYRTVETIMIFNSLNTDDVAKEGLVALTGIEPVFRP